MRNRGFRRKTEMHIIPRACQYENLCASGKRRIYNESTYWIVELQNHSPLWNRLKLNYCADQTKANLLGKYKNYTVELPGRLLSLFGNANNQMNCMFKMKYWKKYQILSCIFALCAALKYQFQEWSENLLDIITASAVEQYPELLRQLSITDHELNMNHLNQVYNFTGINFKVQIQRVAAGYLYIGYSSEEFNLARALTWFFRYYQFGILECCNRMFAFGNTLNPDYGFFMYDCQSEGYPIFEENEANNYILKTSYLQILLYCFIVTLNVTEKMTEFTIHRVDVTILDPLETAALRKEIYVPTIIPANKPLNEERLSYDSEPRNNNITSRMEDTDIKLPNISKETLTQSTASLTLEHSTQMNEAKSMILNSDKSHQRILLDPDKMYYIIALPRASNIDLAKVISDKLFTPNVKCSRNLIKPAIRKKPKNIPKKQNIVNTVQFQEPDDSVFHECWPTTSIKSTASSITLTPESILENYSYSVSETSATEDIDIYDPNEPSINDDISAAYQMKLADETNNV